MSAAGAFMMCVGGVICVLFYLVIVCIEIIERWNSIKRYTILLTCRVILVCFAPSMFFIGLFLFLFDRHILPNI